MHVPERKYTTCKRRGAQLPENDRWMCLQATPGGNANWCGIKHTSQDVSVRHCEQLRHKHKLKGKARFKTMRIYRTERYAAGELLYRGWTEDLIESLLGEPDAQDRGDKHIYEPRLYDADRVHD